MNGRVFCGNIKCDKECIKSICHVPRNTPCVTEFNWKPDKNGECKEYEPIKLQDGEGVKKYIYLAGAMGCYGRGADYHKMWRKMATEWFDIYSSYTYNYDFRCIDPTQYYDYGEDYHKSEKEVMLFDLRKVRSADVILVNLKDIEKSPGTIDEVFYAWINKIPVVGFLEKDNGANDFELHPWVTEQIDRIEVGNNAMKKAMIYIKDYYGEWR